MNPVVSDCGVIEKPSLISLFFVFLKIGSTAFGGFMSLISVVQNYVVEREKLLSNEEMLDGISLATVLPGPMAVNVVAYAGYRISGVTGAIVCTVAVILPSFFLMLLLSYAYLSWGRIDSIAYLFQGFLPAVTAIIVAAVIKIGKSTIKGPVELSIALSAMVVLIMLGGFYVTLSIIIVSGLLGWALYGGGASKIPSENGFLSTLNKSISKSDKRLTALFTLMMGTLVISTLKASVLLPAKLYSVFFMMSIFLFGGGFVFIPIIQESVVNGYNWVSHREFIDAIAMGQVTPGPILISATFIGYKVAGVAGAIAATVGIFAPPAVLMIIAAHSLSNIEQSRLIQSMLKGIRCGVIGMILSAAIFITLLVDINIMTVSIFVVSLVLLVAIKLEVVWIIPLSGIASYLYNINI